MLSSRRSWYILTAAGMVLFLTLLTLPFFLDVDRWKPMVKDRLEKELKQPVEFSRLSVSLLGGCKLRIYDLKIGKIPTPGTPGAVHAGSLVASFPILSLLRGDTRPSHILLKDAVISVYQKEGKWTFHEKTDGSGNPPASIAPSGTRSISSPPELSLPALTLENGTMQLFRPAEIQPLVLKEIQFSLDPNSFGKGYEVGWKSLIQDVEKGQISFSGEIGFLPGTLVLPVPLRLDFSLENIPTPLIERFFPSDKTAPWSDLQGILDGSGNIEAADSEALHLQMELKARELSNRTGSSPVLISSLSLKTDAVYQISAQSLGFQKSQLLIGQSRIRAEGVLENLFQRPQGKCHLLTEDARPADLLALASLFRKSEVPTRTTGQIKADLTLEGPLDNPLLSGKIASEDLLFHYADLPEPVRLSRVEIDLAGDHLKSNTFQAGIGSRNSIDLSLEADRLGSDPSLRFHAETRQPMPVSEILRIAVSLGFSPPAALRVESGNASFQIEGRDLRLKSGRFQIAGQADVDTLTLSAPTGAEKVLVSPLHMKFAGDNIQANRFHLSLPGAGKLEVTELTASDHPAGFGFQARIRTMEPLQAVRWLDFAGGFGWKLPQEVQLKNGSFTLTAEIKRAAGSKTMSYSAAGRLQNARIHCASLKEDLTVEQASFQAEDNRMEIRALQAQWAETRLRGNLQGNLTSKGPVVLQFQLQADKVDMDRWSELLDTSPAAEGKGGPSVSGTSDSGWWKRLRIENGSLAIAEAKSKKIKASDIRILAGMQDLILTIGKLDCRLYGGTHQGTLRLDFHHQKPLFTYQGKVQDMDVGPFLADSTLYRDLLQGKVQATLRVNGEANPSGFINPSTRGDGSFILKDGRITSVSLARQIQLVTRLTGWNITTSSTQVDEAEGTFEQEGAVLILKKTQIRTPEALLATTGTVNTENRALNLAAMAELSSQWKPSGNTLGQIIGSVADTFFRDENGRMIVPFRITGTTHQPKFSLDRETIQTGVQRALKPENIRSGIKAIQDLLQQITGTEEDRQAKPGPTTTIP